MLRENGSTQRQRSPTGGRSRVLIVDDHELVRAGLAELIDQEPDLAVGGEADGVSAAMECVKAERPDVAVIDLSLRDGSGLELIERIHEYDPAIPILVLSMHDELLYAERVLGAGALGYVNKQEPADRVLKAIRRVLDGQRYVSRRMAERQVGAAGPDSRSPLERLTDREMQVLRLIGAGKATREIAAELQLSVKTVDTYREHLKAKLGLESANELLRYAVAWCEMSDRE